MKYKLFGGDPRYKFIGEIESEVPLQKGDVVNVTNIEDGSYSKYGVKEIKHYFRPSSSPSQVALPEVTLEEENLEKESRLIKLLRKLI